MVANAPGSQGGFGGSVDPKGPTAGFDPVVGRKGKKYMKGKRKQWLDYLSSNGRRN